MNTDNDEQLTVSAVRAVKSILNGPNWTTNLLWLSIAGLLQSVVVGPIFLLGYGASLLQGRAGLPDRNSPDIDSSRLGNYFMQGLWPYLVNFVASIAASVLTIPFMILLAIFASAGSAMGDRSTILVLIFVVPLVIVLCVTMSIFIAPFTIRAMLCQDFQKSFDMGWCMRFIKLTFWEVALSVFVFMILGIAISFLGLALFCVGIVPAVGLLNGAAMHLLAQWYELFLSRGGEPVDPGSDGVVDANLI